MSDPKIKLMIVDDHTVVRNGIKYGLLAFNDITLVGEAESGEQAVALCAGLHPDVVLMDVKLDGMGGIAATQAIRRQYPHIQVIALTSFHDKEMIEAMTEAGAISYLLKNVSMQQLAQAIRAAHRRQPVYDPKVTQTLLEAADEPPPPAITLTDRQQETLRLLVDGLSNMEIARQLDVSPHTARYHVSAILAKLGATNRAEAVSIALKYGLVA